MRKKINILTRLVRLDTIGTDAILMTSLGMFAVKYPILSSYGIEILIANFLVLAFAYIINDIEDAEDDALDSQKVKRNPISSGELSKKEAYIYTIICAVLSLFIYSLFSFAALQWGALVLILGFLYSKKEIRLKALPIVDVLSHAFFLGGGLILTTVTGITGVEVSANVMQIFFLIFMVSVAGSFHNQITDYEVDKKAGLKNTLNLIGYKAAVVVKNLVLAICILLGVVVIYSYYSFVNWPITIIILLFFTMFIAYQVIVKKKNILELRDATIFSTLKLVISIILLSAYYV